MDQQLIRNNDASSSIEETFAKFCRQQASHARAFASNMALCDALVATAGGARRF
jgi:hypothetical protein